MDLFDLRNWPNFATAGGDLTQPALIDHLTIDSRRIHSPHSLFVALKGSQIDGHQFIDQAAKSGAKYALVSKSWQGVATGLELLRVDDTLKAFQEIAQTYRRQLPTKVIGVTGSYGKTMLKDLLLALLTTQHCVTASPESFNSQIGVPLSLLTLSNKDQLAIIEASISKIEEMDILAGLIDPDYTILTPIGKKHLASLNDLETLSEEMHKLVKSTSPSGWTLTPSDTDTDCKHSYFWDQDNEKLPHAILLNPDSRHYKIQFPDGNSFIGEIKVGFSYFLNLINMAIKAAWLLGITSENIKSVLQDFVPESTYSEIWKTPKGSIFVNEPYSSDPQSIDRALKHFNYAPQNYRRVFVFGGLRKHNHLNEFDYKKIGQAIAQAPIDHLILTEDNPPLYKELIKEVRSKMMITIFPDESEAFAYLSDFVQETDFVLIKGKKKIPLDKLTEIFHDSLSNNQCLINLAAITSNLQLIRKKLPENTRIMVAVKALAYGTDDVRMAKFLNGCGIDILCVSYIDEGITLKRAGVKQAIFSINAAPYEASKAVKWDLEVGASQAAFIEIIALEAKKQNKQIKVHLHIDTGMGRFGCRPDEALGLAKLIQSFPELILEGIMTHFACADDPAEDAFTEKQIQLFDRVIAEIKAAGINPKWIHAANSSAALRFNLPQYNMVRIGLAAYGLYLSEAVKETLDLRLALTLTSRIVGMNSCKKGESVSYGKSYLIEKEQQTIAVLPIGYFDGLHRNYSGKAHVMIRGKLAPMVGRICMDYMMVDVTDIEDVAIGDKVLIFGQDEYGFYLSPEELAVKGNSIIHELMTCLGPRIQRIFIDEESQQKR